MKKFKVQIEAEVEIEFDENSDDFKILWDSYVKHFDNNVTYETFCGMVASHIARYGVDDLIEGVGFLKFKGEDQTIFYNGEYKERKGYVSVDVDVDLNSKIDFEISYVEEVE